MGTTVEDLPVLIEKQDNEKITALLRAITTQGKHNDLTKTTLLVALLASSNVEILTLTAEIVAECAKDEANRKLLTSNSILTPLLSSLKIGNSALCKQLCRAIGNICFENNEARTIIGTDGLEVFITFVERCIYEKDEETLATVCGCFFNLLMENDNLQKKALNCNTLWLVESILRNCVEDFERYEVCLMHLLHILNLLVEHQNTDEWISNNLCCILVDLLKQSTNSEISILCLEVLHAQSQNDDIKFLLAKKGTCELIFDLVERYKDHADDEDSRAALRMTCDLIVVILIGEKSMDFLYSNGTGKLYHNMLSWMDSNDVDLLSAGILAIGNFARNDEHCIQMVRNGIAAKLLDLLNKNNTLEGDVKVQHALLSAIRNLVIPMQNKAQVLRLGLINTLLPMLNIEHSPVVFKLLATMRIVTDNQEAAALELITHDQVVEKAVYWCFNSEHLGVRGEASRLLAWLIRHCHSTKSFPQLIAIDNFVKCLVEMLTSNYAVMQNESLIALSLLSSGILQQSSLANVGNKNGVKEKLQTDLIEANLGNKLAFLLSKHKDVIEKETLCNILSFLKCVSPCTEVTSHFKQSNVYETLNCTLTNRNYADKLESLKEILSAANS